MFHYKPIQAYYKYKFLNLKSGETYARLFIKYSFQKKYLGRPKGPWSTKLVDQDFWSLN